MKAHDDSWRQADLAQLIVDDPHQRELLARAKSAFDNLPAYMTQQCQAPGTEVPGEWRYSVTAIGLRRRREQKGDLVQAHSTKRAAHRAGLKET